MKLADLVRPYAVRTRALGQRELVSLIPVRMLAQLPLATGSSPVDIATLELPAGLVALVDRISSDAASDGKIVLSAVCDPDPVIADEFNWGIPVSEALLAELDLVPGSAATFTNAWAHPMQIPEPVVVTFQATSYGTPGDPAVNEIQYIHFATNSSAWTLSFDGETTAPGGFASLDAAVQAALETLPNIDPGDVSVTYPGSGDHAIVEFLGRYAGADVPLIVLDGPDKTSGDFAEVAVEGRAAGSGGPGGATITDFAASALVIA